MAEPPRLPTSLCTPDRTRSAPAASACSGSASWNAKCAPQASSTISGTFQECATSASRSEEHTSELQSRSDLVCRLLLEKKKKKTTNALGRTKNKSKVAQAPTTTLDITVAASSWLLMHRTGDCASTARRATSTYSTPRGH